MVEDKWFKMREIITTKVVLTILAEQRVVGATPQEGVLPGLTTIPTQTITEGITIMKAITKVHNITITNIQDHQINLNNNKCSNLLKNTKEVAPIIRII